jgi:hypothetical protein
MGIAGRDGSPQGKHTIPNYDEQINPFTPKSTSSMISKISDKSEKFSRNSANTKKMTESNISTGVVPVSTSGVEPFDISQQSYMTPIGPISQKSGS